MWDGQPFSGSKVALLCGGQTVVYLRDDKPTIPFPAMWDLPGGGREGDEDPVTCGLREVEEEFGLKLPTSSVNYIRKYPCWKPDGLADYFCAAEITLTEVSEIKFGDEGQRWELMAVERYLDLESAIPHLQERLSTFLKWRVSIS